MPNAVNIAVHKVAERKIAEIGGVHGIIVQILVRYIVAKPALARICGIASRAGIRLNIASVK